MKKLFYVLCMSALIFTGCSKSSSPKSGGGGAADSGDDTADIVKTFCEEHPESDLCQAIEGKTELTLQDVKPVMKLKVDGDEILYGASNPSGWAEGFSNLAINIKYILNFSVEAGSTLTSGTPYTYWSFNATTGEFFAQVPSEISDTEGGIQDILLYNNTAKGQQISRIAVFDNDGTYLYLPPLNFVS